MCRWRSTWGAWRCSSVMTPGSSPGASRVHGSFAFAQDDKGFKLVVSRKIN